MSDYGYITVRVSKSLLTDAKHDEELLKLLVVLATESMEEAVRQAVEAT